MTDHDLLIRLDERQQKIHDCLKKHIDHHWAVTILAISALVSGFMGLIVALATWRFSL